MMIAFTDELTQRLKAALWWSVGKIVDEETVRVVCPG